MKNVSLEVIVLDSKQRRLDDARVQISSRNSSDRIALKYRKDLQSYFTLDVEPGPCQIVAEVLGAESEERDVLVEAGQHREIFVLGPKGLPFYYQGTVRIPFEPPKDKIGVSLLDRREGEKALDDTIEEFPLEKTDTPDTVREDNVVILRWKDGTSGEDRRTFLHRLNELDFIRVAGPLLHENEEYATFLTCDLIVKFELDVSPKRVGQICNEFNLKNIRPVPYAGNAFLLRGRHSPDLRLLEIANALRELKDVIYAEPNLVQTAVDHAIVPTDYLFPEQWFADLINLPDAWETLQNANVPGINPGDPGDITFGSENIVVAVPDRGIQSQTVGGITTPLHPDFLGTVTGGAAKVSQFYDFATMQPNNDNPPNNHGMGCSTGVGLLANNPSAVAGTNEGGVGAGPNLRLLGVIRPAGGTDLQYGDSYVWMSGFQPGWVVDGLNYPVGTVFPAPANPPADIITNSHGYGAVATPSILSDVVDFITTYGRNGKGVLMFWSAGNYPPNQPVTCGMALLPKVMCVGASTFANDGATEILSAYSQTGNSVEFCAPSHDTYVARSAFHNPNANFAVTSADLIGQGNLNGVPQNTAALAAAVNAGPFTQLTAQAAVGTNTLNVADTAGFAAGQQIRIAQHADRSSETVTITAVNAVANTLTVTATTNGPHLVNAPVFGPVNLAVDDTSSFVAGRWLNLSNPGAADFETVRVQSVTDANNAVVTEMLRDHPAGTQVVAGPNNYRNSFGGTSWSTPLTAGVAGLVLSVQPSLTWIEVRQILRDTADKINPADNGIGIWTDVNGLPSTNPAFIAPFYSIGYGFGRINANAAVVAARDYPFDRDIVIRENTGDDGSVPSSGVFYRSCDLWVRNASPIAEGNAALPADYDSDPSHENPDSSQDNWVYVRFKNTGGTPSLDFYVRVYLTHFPGFEFSWPTSFQPSVNPGDPIPNPLVPGTYLLGEVPYTGLAAGADDFVTIQWNEANIPPATVDVGGTDVTWHPCLLAEITPHDGPTPTGPRVWDNNNLAQRNLTIFYPDGGDEDFAAAGMMGDADGEGKGEMTLVIRRNGLPKDVHLWVRFLDRKQMELIRREGESRDYRFGTHNDQEVIWLSPQEEVKIRVQLVGKPLFPVLFGGVAPQVGIRATFEVSLHQYNAAGKETGALGYELKFGREGRG
jgi:hypothetical protein